MNQVDGREVGRYIQEVGAVKARALLIGCVLDDQNSEDGWVIASIGRDGTIECRPSSGPAIRVAPAQLPQFLVVDERLRPRLRQTLEARLPEQERHARQIGSQLARHGLSPASGEDADVLIFVLDAVERGQIPGFEQQQQFYEACKRAAESRDKRMRRQALIAGARLFAEIERLMGRLEPSLRIKLAFFLRHAGERRDAVAATDFIEDKGVNRWVKSETLAILATERAAALADQYEWEHNEAALSSAEYWGKRAFAISDCSAEAAKVLARIRSLCRC